MIITFTKKLTIATDFTPEFFFNRIYTASGIHFHVSVVDKLGQFCHFTMAESKGKWRIVNAPQPPVWITEVEAALDSIICQGMLS